MALNVSGLTEYVNVHRDELLVKAAAGSKTLLYVDIMDGVRFKDSIPYLDSEVELRNGGSCDWQAGGSDTFTERTIESHPVAVNKEFCWKDFEKTFANYQLKWEAGRETLPFEQAIAESNLGKIQEAVEDMVWQGDATVGVTGFLADIAAESALTKEITGITSANTIVEKVDAVVAGLESLPAIKKGAYIFLSHSDFNAYIQALNASCCANRQIIDAAVESLTYVGDSRITLVPVAGLEGTGAIVGATKDALVYGCDVDEDSAKAYKFWYEDKTDKFYFKVLFRSGTALRWPDEIVYIAGE